MKKTTKFFIHLILKNYQRVLENDDNFKNIDDGLAKLDSFLN